MLTPWKKSNGKPKQHIKKQRYYFAYKIRIVKTMAFPIVIYGYESWTIKKSWALKNLCLWNIVLEKTLESPLDKGMKPVSPKGNQYWIFIGRTDAEAEAYFDHWMQRANALEKTLMLGKIEGRRRKWWQRMR